MKGVSVGYIWNRLLKKIRGVAVINSQKSVSTKFGSGSQIINSTFGKYSYCGYDCKVINCQVGSFTSIADKVIIGGLNHPYDWVSTSPVFYEDRSLIKHKFTKFKRGQDPITTIGSDVWIGEGAYIKAGVNIGHGSVIGMGSVVTKDVPPYSIVAGIPANVIKKRFADSICEALLRTEWWNLSEEGLNNLSTYIQNPEQFIQNLYLK